ncbi:MAG: virulence factor family protein, partial [Pseudomonas sp.]
MIRRYWLYLLAILAAGLLAAAAVFWLWTRPAPEPSLEHLTLGDGSSLTRVTPGVHAKARVAIAVTQDQALTDKQLLNLSQSGQAQMVQVILPPADCTLQQTSVQQALQQLQGPATLVAGIGPGAAQAWAWLA